MFPIKIDLFFSSISYSSRHRQPFLCIFDSHTALVEYERSQRLLVSQFILDTTQFQNKIFPNKLSGSAGVVSRHNRKLKIYDMYLGINKTVEEM